MDDLAEHAGCIIYTVKARDTLCDIFRRFDISICDLLAHNKSNLFALEKGQTLYIKAAQNKRSTGYVLGEDETLFSVAKKFDISVSALLKANADVMPQEIRQGICIALPVSSSYKLS